MHAFVLNSVIKKKNGLLTLKTLGFSDVEPPNPKINSPLEALATSAPFSSSFNDAPCCISRIASNSSFANVAVITPNILESPLLLRMEFNDRDETRLILGILL